jgi:hypothetical protein
MHLHHLGKTPEGDANAVKHVAVHIVAGSVVWLQPHHRTNHNGVFKLIILITITLASSNNTLPYYGD